MIELPLISIIIPVYNTEKYVNRCLDSIINQTYKNIDVIIVDDGSTDNAGKMCDKYAIIDSRIRVFHMVNRGVSAARNFGIENARGKYLTFIDSDDYVDKNFILSMYNELINSNADISICGYAQEHNGEFCPHYSKDIVEKLNNQEMIVQMLMQIKYSYSPWDKLFVTSIVKEERFPEDISNNEDLFFVYNVMKKCSTAVFNSRPLYFYCENFESAARVKFSKKNESMLDIQDYILEDISSLYPDIYKIARIEYVKNLLFCLSLVIKAQYDDKKFINRIKNALKEHKSVFLDSDVAMGYKINLILFLFSYNLYKIINKIRK